MLNEDGGRWADRQGIEDNNSTHTQLKPSTNKTWLYYWLTHLSVRRYSAVVCGHPCSQLAGMPARSSAAANFARLLWSLEGTLCLALEFEVVRTQ